MGELTPNVDATSSKLVPAIVASVLVTALVAGGGVYAYQKNQADDTQKDLQSQIDSLKGQVSESKTTTTTSTPSPTPTTSPTATTAATTANLVKYTFASPAINVQFELPEGYGAAKDQEGEGVSMVTFYVGKDLPDSGKNVISTTISIPTYVKIIPSFDASISTLEDWRNKSNISSLKIDSAATKQSDVTVGGVKAERYKIGGMGEYQVIQFVKDKSFYEIRNEVGMDETAVAKIIATLSFK